MKNMKEYKDYKTIKEVQIDLDNALRKLDEEITSSSTGAFDSSFQKEVIRLFRIKEKFIEK